MIPILYDTNETDFTSNGLGRLRDCIECTVTEERNSIYECDFSYPITGANFDKIKVGRIIGVTHEDSNGYRESLFANLYPLEDEQDEILADENGADLYVGKKSLIPEYDIQPFDIVSYSRPINGIVTFHCTHISYRQRFLVVTDSDINSINDAFTAFASSTPANPFTYVTDKSSSGFVAAFDGLPHTVKSLLGGTEGSILDAYGGEYEWSKWTVYLHAARGQTRNFTIRYGVNMLDYNEDYDIQEVYSSCVPYWTDGTDTVIGDRVDSYGTTVTGRGECVPLDLSDRFADQPTKAEVEAGALSYMTDNNTFLPKQSIKVDFVRLQELGEYKNIENLFQCNLCDTINVVFPDYNAIGQFKIVKTTWNVLKDRYESMELGELTTTLAEALGIK